MKCLKPILMVLLVLASCNAANNDNLKRENILGRWILLDDGMSEASKQRPKAEIITAFTLNRDSTATLYSGNFVENERKYVWKWQAEKRLGNDHFALSISTDVLIMVNGIPKLGLVVENNSGKVQLTSGNFVFEMEEM